VVVGMERTEGKTKRRNKRRSSIPRGACYVIRYNLPILI